MSRPMPGTPAPALTVPTLTGPWTLADQTPGTFTMLVFYRGYHCPICKGFLGEIERMLPEFEQNGASVIALSMDTEDRARKTAEDWGLSKLRLGYGLTEQQATDWGLYLTSAIRDTELPVFSEPGLFLIDTEGRFYMINVASMPFARPDLTGLPARLSAVKANGYPARGTRG